MSADRSGTFRSAVARLAGRTSAWRIPVVPVGLAEVDGRTIVLARPLHALLLLPAATEIAWPAGHALPHLFRGAGAWRAWHPSWERLEALREPPMPGNTPVTVKVTGRRGAYRLPGTALGIVVGTRLEARETVLLFPQAAGVPVPIAWEVDDLGARRGAVAPCAIDVSARTFDPAALWGALATSGRLVIWPFGEAARLALMDPPVCGAERSAAA